MLQNLVNLKPTTPVQEGKLPAKAGQEHAERGFGQLLDKSSSGMSDREVLRSLNDATMAPPNADGVEFDVAKLEHIGAKMPLAEAEAPSLEIESVPQQEITPEVDVSDVVGEMPAKSELFDVVEAGTILIIQWKEPQVRAFQEM